jgi:hypothetical protein
MRELHGEWHELGRFVGRVTEHDALITGTARIDSHGDVARLFADELSDANAVGVECFGRVDVADFADRSARDRLVVDVCARRDLAGQDNLPALTQHFTGDAAVRITGEMRVENRVGDVIANLVGMSLADRFRRERVRAH